MFPQILQFYGYQQCQNCAISFQFRIDAARFPKQVISYQKLEFVANAK